MSLTPEQKEVGKGNFDEALGVHRRIFLKQVIGATLVPGASVGAMYFGYDKVEKPVRVGVIGTGDEGSVLIGACNPDYIQVVAIADIRPSSIHRAFHGDYRSKATPVEQRPGLMSVYDWKTEAEARKHVAVYTDYQELLKDSNVEAVIIALPLHLHHKAAIEAMEAGKDVITEKLMAHTVGQCKEMAKKARELNKILATGHQRHYSVLYDNAVSLLRWGMLGELQFIRAQWHRGNLPGKDSWQKPLPGGESLHSGEKKDDIVKELRDFRDDLKKEKDPKKVRWLKATIAQWEKWNSDRELKAKDYGYQDITLDKSVRPAHEELHRWRLWDRTGGGLMAELGSHQLDAASIFISALRADGKKANPLTVHAVGGRHTFPLDRDAGDHVYCMYEFPGPGYDIGLPEDASEAKRRSAALKKFGYYDNVTGYPGRGIPSYDVDPNKKIVVTYSSIMGNGYGAWGETVMGSKGTLILEKEKEVKLFKGSDTSTKVSVKDDQGGPTFDTQESPTAAPIAKAAATGPVSRGYREELEHWAWCIRNRAPENQPKCKPEVALGDAVIALTTKLAIARANAGLGGFVKFKEEWFKVDDPATPEEDLAIKG